jgi:hypothetical protein
VSYALATRGRSFKFCRLNAFAFICRKSDGSYARKAKVGHPGTQCSHRLSGNSRHSHIHPVTSRMTLSTRLSCCADQRI